MGIGPIILVGFLIVIFVGIIALATYLQKQETAKFESECQKEGWKNIPRDRGYDVLPENDEQWKVESRAGNPNTPSSVEWSHPMPPHLPLIILPKSGIALLNEIPLKGVQLIHPEIFKDTKQISIGSENLRKRYSVYGTPEITEHSFLNKKVESLLISYVGADFILVLFPDRLEIRLRDRNVRSQVPALIRLGCGMISAHNSAE